MLCSWDPMTYSHSLGQSGSGGQQPSPVALGQYLGPTHGPVLTGGFTSSRDRVGNNPSPVHTHHNTGHDRKATDRHRQEKGCKA